MRILSEVDKAWLAGFIDGEGYIGITFQLKKETRSQASSPRYHPYLIIVNTNRYALEQASAIIGDGRIYIAHKTNGRHKESYQYKLTKMDSLMTALQDIAPFLKIKQKQAYTLMDFIKKRKAARPITGRGSRGQTSFDAVDSEVYHNLLALNKRGKQDKL